MSNSTDTNERLRVEAYALRYALTVDRPEALGEVQNAAYALRPWLDAVRREVDAGAGVSWADAVAILDRPHLKPERDALQAAGLDLAAGVDPAELRAAYADALAGTESARVRACVRSAARLLADAEAAEGDADRRALIQDAVRELTRPQAEGDAPLADAWQAHLDLLAADVAGPDVVLRLDAARRGPWAEWFNAWLGPRAGLEAGQTFILGGAPEAGKTSLAALLAVDALAADCPVLFWQLELGREETLEHLQAQRPDLDGWPTRDFWGRARRPLPAAWGELLQVPRYPAPNVEAVQAAVVNMAHQAERARRRGSARHKVNGLAIVDYAQLLTLADAGPRNAQHEILCTAASRLAKAAAEAGACLLLLSQLNKGEQREGTTDGTALAGADLARMAHRVALLQRADAKGNACKAGDEVDFQPGKGEARLLTWTKARGVRYTDDGRRPDRRRVFWNGGRSRALHGGDAAEKRGLIAPS